MQEGDRWSRIKELFDMALDADPSQRSAFLEQACAGDNDLLAEVQSLLSAYDNSNDLSQPFWRQEDSLAEERKFVGPFRLIQKLGEGGMGQVWLAEQTAPVKRQVALKLIRGTLFDSAALHRFQSERQSLAIMDHPAIAKVFDAGTTADGQPYFVMEYVRGLPITEYCDQKKLEISERLELFVNVCEGVQHAHQKAIIHRDLKPANILVVDVDSKPQPKIIDFGLAKGITPDVLGDSDLTLAGSFLGTPGYMSPEQVEASTQDVDTRTDVYSLGVVLYVLLTGSLPFVAADGKPQAVHEALRQLREDDPPRPSTKASAQSESTRSAAEARGTEPKQLARLLSGDLDWIALKALERDRARRYATPTDLAADILRYLHHEPVKAHPAGVWYQSRKFLWRHRVLVTTGMLVMGSLLVGLTIANRERVLAQRRFQDVRELANKLFDIDVQVRELPGNTKARQLIVTTSLDYLHRLSADVQGDPGLALDVGTAYMRVARVQGVPIGTTLGQKDEADNNLRIADSLIHSVLQMQPDNRMAMLRAAQIAHDRMILARFDNKDDDALSFAKRSAGWLEKYNAGKDDEAEASAILSTYLNVADQFKSEDEFDEALRLCARATEIAKSLGRTSNQGDFLWVSAQIYQRRGDLDEAYKDIQESVNLLDPGPEWLTKSQSRNYILALVYRGRILDGENTVNMSQPEEALQSLNKAFTMADEFVHRDPRDHAAKGTFAMAAISLGAILRRVNASQAWQVYDHALSHLTDVSDDRHLQRFEVNLLAGASYPLRRMGRETEARQKLRVAFDLLNRLKFYPSDKLELDSEAADTLRAMADDSADNSELKRSAELYQELLDKADPTEADRGFNVEDAVQLSNLLHSTALIYRRCGRADKAAALENRRRKVWQTWDRKAPNHPFIQQQLRLVSAQ